MVKRQTGVRVEDVTGCFQKSAEVIVGRKRTATDASVEGGSLTETRRTEC